MIKLIATDMDGTFLDSNKQFDPEFIDIFYKLKEKGIKFVIASGNQYFRLYQKFLPLSEQMYFIAENGCFIAEGSRELYHNTLSVDCLKKIKNILKEYPQLPVIMCGRKGAYILEKDRDFENIVKMHYCNYQLVASYDEIDDEIMKISINDPEGKIEEKLALIEPLLPEEVKIVTAGNVWMDIHNKEINKGIGMRFLQAIYEIEPDECMAFGDQMNDYELLQQVKYGYAMENAVDPIKEIAYGLTASNDEQGVLLKIKEVLGAVTKGGFLTFNEALQLLFLF